MPKSEDQVGELVLLEFGDKLLVLLVGELAGVVFKDSLGSLATGCIEENYCGNIIPCMAWRCCLFAGSRPTPEIPSCLALNPRLTSCPVRPLTSFDAAQSSRMNRVLVPEKW